MNLGAGRVVMQDLPRIDPAVADGELARNPALTDFIAKLKASGGTCHLMGLLSPGGVHSHQDHIAALANDPSRQPALPSPSTRFLDGRDTPPNSAERLRGGIRRRHRRPAKARASPPSAAAISPWTATSAGSAWQLAYDALVDRQGRRPRRPRSPRSTQPIAAARPTNSCKPTAIGELRRHERRRRLADGEFPRRPRAADPDRAARSRVRRLRPRQASCDSPPPSA